MTNKLSHIFECSDHITEKQYRTSRALFILDGCASTQIFTVTSGAFLSGLAYLVGAGTALTGIIAALPTLMNTIQIFSSVVYENRAGSKRITVEFALIQRLCLLMMLFVPTLMLGARISVAVIAVLYSCAHFCGAFWGHLLFLHYICPGCIRPRAGHFQPFGYDAASYVCHVVLYVDPDSDERAVYPYS